MGNSYFEGGQAPAPPAPDLQIEFTQDSYSHLNNTNEQTAMEILASPSAKKLIHQVSLDGNAFSGGCTVRRYLKIDGTNYRRWNESDVFGSGSPTWYNALQMMALDFDFKVTLESGAPEGVARTVERIKAVEDLQTDPFRTLTFTHATTVLANNSNEQDLVVVTASPSTPKRLWMIALDVVNMDGESDEWKHYEKVDSTNYRFRNEGFFDAQSSDNKAFVVWLSPMAIEGDTKITWILNSPSGTVSVPYVVVTEDLDVVT